MVICNSDYVVLKKKPDTITTSHRRGILYRVVSTSVSHGDTYAIAAPADMNYERAKVHGYIHLPTNMFERVIVRPAGVPEHWEIVRVDMPAEWEYYQDPVDGLIYQSVTGAMPPYAAVNVVRSTGPQEKGMPSHNKKYETVKQNDCQGVSPSVTIPSGNPGTNYVVQGVVCKSQPVRTDDSPLRKTGPYPVHVDEQAGAKENDSAGIRIDDLIRDAKRYRWLRVQHWNDSKLCVVESPKKAVKLGQICPSEEQLDQAIDQYMYMTPNGADDTHAVRSKQMGWPESTAVEAEAWADLQEQYDVWTETLKQDGQEITLHQFLVSDDIDESSGCWRMVIATQEWVDTMQYKRCVKRATIGTHVVPKTS